jgi:DNA-binding NtrC family response regulator
VLIERALARSGRTVRLTTRAHEALRARRWPGNVRELDHTLAQALLASNRPTLDLDDLGTADAPRSGEPAAPSLHARRDALTREVVLATLEAHQGNRTHAARALGVSRFGLQKILRRLHAS